PPVFNSTLLVGSVILPAKKCLGHALVVLDRYRLQQLFGLAFIVIFLSSCGSRSSSSTSSAIVPQKAIPIITLQGPSQLFGGESATYKATLAGSNGQVVWTVDGVQSGSDDTGRIDSNGLFTAPINVEKTVTISATLTSNTAVTASLQVEILGPVQQPNVITFGFTLPAAAHTSAGVYQAGRLVRTLWSNEELSAGKYLRQWDGDDDLGSQSPQGEYEVRVLSNNVSYEWGVIGTTSSWTGPKTWHSQSTLPRDMVIVGQSAITGNGYSEGRPNASMFQL